MIVITFDIKSFFDIANEKLKLYYLLIFHMIDKTNKLVVSYSNQI